MHNGRLREVDAFLHHKHGHWVPVHVRAIPRRNERGAFVGAVELFEERTAAPEEERRGTVREHPQEPRRLALDRPVIESRLAAQCREFEETHQPFTTLLVRIDGLDRLREQCGHHAVEAVRSAIARTISGSVSRADWVGWWTPGLLLAILPDCRPGALPEIARRLKELAAQTAVLWWGERLSVALAAGGAETREGDTPESIVSRCEGALST
jgi:GGDEF domain-containing protein